MSKVTMEKLVSWAKRRGFVFPSSEIYGGFANSYDYGPLGTELKNNIKQLWWKSMVHEREDIEGIDGAILTDHKVWEASGHVDNFTDPMVDCRSCKKRFRADKLLEGKVDSEKMIGKSLAEIGELLKSEQIACESCGMIDWTDVRKFNLLVECNLGATEEDKKVVNLRGETCQSIYLNYDNVLNTSRQKIPFGIAQIGKAFRNEITPGNFIFRLREFEQMEMQYFVHQNDAQKTFDYWREERMKWLVEVIGLKKENVRQRQQAIEERAHYSKDAYDVEYNSPFGWAEFEGLHNRGDWDLTRHSMFSGKKLEYFDQETKEKYIPWIIETSIGADRLSLMVMLDAYEEQEVGEGDVRTVMHFKPSVAPIKVAILPLMKKEPLADLAKSIYNQLKSQYVCQYDVTGSIGKRYRRQDEIGTPLCVTIDFESLEDGQVTVRDRDTMEQKRMLLADLSDYVREKIK